MTDINTNVPPGLHPSRFEHLTTDADPAIAGRARAAQQAFTSVYERLSVVPSEVNAIRDDKSLSLAGKQQRADAVRAAAKAEATNTLSKLVEDLDGAVTHYASKLDDAAGLNAEPAPTDAEVRAHVRALPAVERLAFVRSLAANGDRTNVNAVLRGARFLSGLDDVTDAAFAELKGEWLGLLAPEAAKKFNTVRRLRDDVRTGMRIAG